MASNSLSQAAVNSQALGTAAQPVSAMAASGSTPSRSAGGGGSGLEEPLTVTPWGGGGGGKPHPFCVRKHTEKGSYKIFFPQGCLRDKTGDVDGTFVDGLSQLDSDPDWFKLDNGMPAILKVKITHPTSADGDPEFEYSFVTSSTEDEEDSGTETRYYRIAHADDNKIVQCIAGMIEVPYTAPWKVDTGCLSIESTEDGDFGSAEEEGKDELILTLNNFREPTDGTHDTTLAEYLLLPENIPSEGLTVLARLGTGADAKLVYVKIVESESSSSASSSSSFPVVSSSSTPSSTPSSGGTSSTPGPGGSTSSGGGGESEDSSDTPTPSSSGDGGYKFTLKSGNESNVKFSLDGAEESSSVEVELGWGETPEVTMNVYYL